MPVAKNFLILNWHGDSKTATLKEMKTLFDFCDEYNKRNDPPTPNLKIQVICGDSNITKYKQLITVKEAIISCKPEAIIRGGENYSDKRISKFRWGEKCERDILLNNQWIKQVLIQTLNVYSRSRGRWNVFSRRSCAIRHYSECCQG